MKSGQGIWLVHDANPATVSHQPEINEFPAENLSGCAGGRRGRFEDGKSMCLQRESWMSRNVVRCTTAYLSTANVTGSTNYSSANDNDVVLLFRHFDS